MPRHSTLIQPSFNPLGGTFRIEGGTVKTHVQPDWAVIESRSPSYYDAVVDKVVGPFLSYFTGVGPDLVSALLLAIHSRTPTMMKHERVPTLNTNCHSSTD